MKYMTYRKVVFLFVTLLLTVIVFVMSSKTEGFAKASRRGKSQEHGPTGPNKPSYGSQNAPQHSQRQAPNKFGQNIKQNIAKERERIKKEQANRKKK
jgi:hypothetical protein